MLAIKDASKQQKLTPNLLPCAIRHDGPVPVDQRYWAPVSDNGKETVYFRGRKLEGTSVKLPDGYQGVLLQKTEQPLLAKPSIGLEEDETQPIETKIFSKQASFDEVVVWGHEMVPDADDAYLKGVQEWISFAEAVSQPAIHMSHADCFQMHAEDKAS